MARDTASGSRRSSSVPYARKGFIDHQQLSFDAYNKFIEADFLGGQAIDPKTDGRPDPRPDVPERTKGLGNLLADFNFSAPPRTRCCCRRTVVEAGQGTP